MIKHGFKSPERNKARGQLDSDEEFQEGCRTTVPTSFNSPSPRKNYTIQSYLWAQTIT